MPLGSVAENIRVGRADLSAADVRRALEIVGLADDLARVLRATGTTALMVTHDADEATRVADRIVVWTSPPAKLDASS